METSLKPQKALQFAEVYVTDMGALKKIFLQTAVQEQNVTAAFGVPFLLAKKDGKIVAFASFVLNAKEEIDFVIYNEPFMSDEERLIFVSFVTDFIKNRTTDNYHDPEQLKNNITRILQWLN